MAVETLKIRGLNRVFLTGDAESLTVRNDGPDTVYYGGPAVTSLSYDGSVAAGGSASVGQGCWVVCASDGKHARLTVTSTAQVASAAPGIAAMMLFGQSYAKGSKVSGAVTGSTDDTEGTRAAIARLASLLRATLTNHAVAGAALMQDNSGGASWNGASTGGWVTIAQQVAPVNATFLSSLQAAVLWHGENDIFGAQGNYDVLDGAFYRALLWSIDRLRAAVVYEDNNAVWTTPVGTWTSQGSATGYASGSTVEYTATEGAQQQHVAPAGTPSSALIVSVTHQDGAVEPTVNVKRNGVTVETVNLASLAFSATEHTPVSIRVPGYTTGDTILVTFTNVGAQARFDGSWVEAVEPPLVILPKSIVPLTFPTINGYTLKAADLAKIDEIRERAAAAYPDVRVVTVDMPGLGVSDFQSDGIHPSPSGAAKIAVAMYEQLTSILSPELVAGIAR